MNLPKFETYCQNTTAGNALRFDFGGVLQVWFSYQTPVAYSVMDGPKRVRRNEWGPTTGKHLNAIDGGDKPSRIDGGQFESSLSKLLEHPTFAGSDINSIMSAVCEIVPDLTTDQMLRIASAIKPIDSAADAMSDDELLQVLNA